MQERRVERWRRESYAKSCRREWIVSEVWSVCVVVVRRERAFGVACVVSCRGESRVDLLQGPRTPNTAPTLRRLFYSCAPRAHRHAMAMRQWQYIAVLCFIALLLHVFSAGSNLQTAAIAHAPGSSAAPPPAAVSPSAYRAIAAANAINGIDRRRANSGAISSYSSTRP